MAVKTYQKNNKNSLTKNFAVNEFSCHGSGCCSTVLIDDALATYLQKIRDHFGKPVTINSGYRCATHNKNIGGATGSYHTKGMAADIAVKDVAPAEVAKYAESIGIKGIGLYETASDGYFVHVDTRTSKSFWYGQKEAYRSTFGGAAESTVAATIKVNVELTELQKGAKGEQVKTLQRLLAALGYNLGYYGADGDFGDATDKAVRAFQKVKKLGVDGIVGKNTWDKLLKG